MELQYYGKVTCNFLQKVLAKNIPDGTWNDKNNRILVINWLINKSKTCNKKIDRKIFAKYGLSELLETYYCDNVKKAIKEALNKNCLL